MQELLKKKREAGLNLLARMGPLDSSLVSRMRQQKDARQGPTCSWLQQTCVPHKLGLRSFWHSKGARQGPTCSETYFLQSLCFRSSWQRKLSARQVSFRVLASANMCPPQTWLQELLAEQRRQAGYDLLTNTFSPESLLQELLAEERCQAGSDFLRNTFSPESLLQELLAEEAKQQAGSNFVAHMWLPD